MSVGLMALYIVAMALVTYVIRMIPMIFFRKKIKSTYLLSLLYYIPYAVLSAMTFPYIFYSTGNVITATIGTVVAIVASVCKRSLITVAVLACIFALATGYIIPLF